MSNSSIWTRDWSQPAITTPSKSWPASDGNERILHIPQSSSVTGFSTLDFLMSCPEHSLGGGLNLLQKFSQCILLPQLADLLLVSKLFPITGCFKKCDLIWDIQRVSGKTDIILVVWPILMIWNFNCMLKILCWIFKRLCFFNEWHFHTWREKKYIK